jgi:hypothetical protein
MVSCLSGAYMRSWLTKVQLVFISLTNILLVTSLISLLSNSLSKVRPCLGPEPLAQISLFSLRGTRP